MSSIKIAGLTGEQNDALKGVKVGDLLWVMDSSSATDSDDEETTEDGGTEDTDSFNGDSDDEISLQSMYIVSKLVKSKSGLVTDITLAALHPAMRVNDADEAHGFQIYGNTIVHAPKGLCAHSDETQCSATTSLRAVLANVTDPRSVDFVLNPAGDTVRRVLYSRTPSSCPISCNDGWLPRNTDLNLYITNCTGPATTAVSIICMFCIGEDLAKEQLNLRAILEQTGNLDLASAIDLTAKLNVRRRVLGYTFHQFDERDWGYYFDDMLSESDEDDDNGTANGDGTWQIWQDAMDPNNLDSSPTKKVSAETIAALPRMSFKETKLRKEHANKAMCLVCMDKFEDSQVVVKLPCGHVYDADCIEQWLHQSTKCPECRAEVPDVGGQDMSSNATGQVVET